MWGVLWLTVWATVGEAFYDDEYWNTQDYGGHQLPLEWQKYVRENFNGSLRTLAKSYAREGYDEMTLAQAKSKLRTLKVFQHTGSSSDYDSFKGHLLPLDEGAKYCTMGRHTKVDCNHCTCVAGQLYMCTGMICPETTGRPQFLSTCREGKKRKIDSCNYCYCQNGHEFCSTKDCRQHHGHYLRQYYCPEGRQRRVECNRCLCHDGVEFCTIKICQKRSKPSQEHSHLQDLLTKRCFSGQTYIKNCDYCTCVSGGWNCQKFCIIENRKIRLLWTRCKEGTTRKLDACNYCYCRNGREYCDNKYCEDDDEHYLSVLRSQAMCVEGSRYMTDSCNFCFCLKGQEYCTYKQCGKHLESIHYSSCENGTKREIDSCNYCTCTNGEFICTQNSCGQKSENKNGFLDLTYLRNVKECESWEVKFEKCIRCICRANHWLCTKNLCDDKDPIDNQPKMEDNINALLESCQKGEKLKLDSCNKCFCRYGKWFCQVKGCDASSNENTDHREDVKYPPLIENSEKNTDIFGTTDLGDNSDIRNTENIEDSKMNGDLKAKLRSYMPTLSGKCKIGKKIKTVCHVCKCNLYGWTCSRRSKCRKADLIARLRQTTPECEPGDIYQLSACNYCFCDFYQKRVCFHDQHCLDESLSLYPLTGPDRRPKCPLGMTQETICHVCKCISYGWLCTKRWKCRNSQKIDALSTLRQLEQECQIGKIYQLRECNYCFCDKNRELVCFNDRVCTQMNAVLRIGHEQKHEDKCDYSDRKRINACNYCWCDFDRRWVCSNHSCPMYDRRNNLLLPNETNCSEGSQRQVNSCNYCICKNGTEFCTQKPCSDSAPKPFNFSEPECISGEPLPDPDSCNQCICVNSNIMCTNLPCVLRSPDVTSAGKCVEGHRYSMNDGCNYCICQGGQDFCTARACLVTEKQVEKNTKCSEGDMTSAGDNCNICVCIEGKFTCTNKNCAETERSRRKPIPYLRLQKPSMATRMRKRKRPRGTKQRCRRGKTYVPDNYDPNCPNDCICDRNEFLCTNRQCDMPFKLKSGSWTNLKSEKRAMIMLKQETCVENRALPSDDPCNSCKCLNGRKVCTVVTCSDQDDAPSDERAGYQGIKGHMERKKSGTFCEPFTFYSPDNNRFCRNCFCLHDGLSLCLLNLCKYSKDIPHNINQELNKRCTPGETGYPTKCLTCTCSEQGQWICTREELALCQERDCDEKDEFQMGFTPYCAGCKCSVKEWFCSIHSNSCNDYSNVTCPIGTLIRNPNQYCSICLCGGYGNGAKNMCFTESKCVQQVTSHLKL